MQAPCVTAQAGSPCARAREWGAGAAPGRWGRGAELLHVPGGLSAGSPRDAVVPAQAAAASRAAPRAARPAPGGTCPLRLPLRRAAGARRCRRGAARRGVTQRVLPAGPSRGHRCRPAQRHPGTPHLGAATAAGTLMRTGLSLGIPARGDAGWEGGALPARPSLEAGGLSSPTAGAPLPRGAPKGRVGQGGTGWHRGGTEWDRARALQGQGGGRDSRGRAPAPRTPP